MDDECSCGLKHGTAPSFTEAEYSVIVNALMKLSVQMRTMKGVDYALMLCAIPFASQSAEVPMHIFANVRNEVLANFLKIMASMAPSAVDAIEGTDRPPGGRLQ